MNEIIHWQNATDISVADVSPSLLRRVCSFGSRRMANWPVLQLQGAGQLQDQPLICKFKLYICTNF